MPPSGQRTFSIYVTNDVALPLATETVVATLGGVSTWSPDNVIRLQGWVSLVNAAGVTGITLRFRRQSLTGTLVGELAAPTTGASANFVPQIDAEDNPGDVAGLPYVLTVTSAGGTSSASTSEIVAIIG